VWDYLSVTTLRTSLALILIAMAGLLAGCGSGHTATSSAKPSPAVSAAAKKQTVAENVIRGWAKALLSGKVSAAARYFALPSIFANGITSGGLGTYEIRTERQARAVNESLSCGARITSITPHGKYFTAEFRLVNRSGAGADCGSGTGAAAATDFVIKNGRIIDWIRAPAGNAAPKIPALPANSAPSSLT
jgi:hypothetical protein